MRNKKNETVTLKKGDSEIQLDYADLRKAVLVFKSSKSQASSANYRFVGR